jgi:chromosome segregation ATPase
LDGIQLTNLLKKQLDGKYGDLSAIYKAMKRKKLETEKELQIVEKERIQFLNSPNVLLESPVNEEIKNLEVLIVKFKEMKNEQMQKLDGLQDLLDHYKNEMKKKEQIIMKLKNDKTRYLEYRTAIETTIKKHNSSNSHSTASGNSSFVQYTPQGHNSSLVSDHSSSRVSYRSARSSLFF